MVTMQLISATTYSTAVAQRETIKELALEVWRDLVIIVVFVNDQIREAIADCYLVSLNFANSCTLYSFTLTL